MARPAQEGPITCLGGKEIRVLADVAGAGTVVCAGEVEDDLHIEGLVQIPAEGTVRGDLRVWSADIAGTVQGDVITRGRLTLRATARVQGDVVTRELVVEAGALLQGQVRMPGEAAARSASWFPDEVPAGTPMKAPAPPLSGGPWATQRQHARYALTLTAIYRVQAAPGQPLPRPWPGETANVSEAGACLSLPERLAPGTSLDLMLRGEAALYEFRAAVVWAGPADAPPIPHGVRLEALSPKDQAAWQLLLFEQHQRGSERATRIVVDLPARCLVDGRAAPLPGEVQNLGVGGLRILLPQLLPVRTLVTVALRSPLQELRLAGRIAWGQARLGERPAHGVEFTDPAAGRNALHQVVLAEFLMRAGRPESVPSP